MVIFDDENLPYAMWEFKAAAEFDSDEEDTIKHQLFGTAPLVGAPRLLVYATVFPDSLEPTITAKCIDYARFRSYEAWVAAGRPHANKFPPEYQAIGYEPYANGETLDLRTDCTQAEFRAVARTFHNEFFGEHPDNVLFVNLVKCLLAKIYDERITRVGDAYRFQVFYRNGREESATDVFQRINSELYQPAFTRYIDPLAREPDEINSKEFSPERVKTVVKTLQAMSTTRGAALHGDVIGAFFEEILRIGFKQDKGMYFTHDNLVEFMLEAVDLRGLVINSWRTANHPDNRLPYVIDPACGSGTFLLKAMRIVTETIWRMKAEVVVDYESQQFYDARMSENMPNYWAEHFIYGLDPKFVMAITAKVNMVLHGDGSAHILKHDAFKPLSSFPDSKFRPAGDPSRSIPQARYAYDVSESYDLVVSNPPFGITLASDTRITLSRSFSLKSSLPSEALYLERCFQLLKPNGRLGLVVPESLINAADLLDARLFLYRCFWIRAIVALPRNVFIDTPTLTSLLFAQKKTHEEIASWDNEWNREVAEAKRRIGQAKAALRQARKDERISFQQIQDSVIGALSPMVDENSWVLKRGKNASVVSFQLPTEIIDTSTAINHYQDLLKFSGFQDIVRSFIFQNIVAKFDYGYPVFIVDEVGYKLSKRRERIRPNQLCRFASINTGEEHPNLHLTEEPIRIEINEDDPQRVLDFIKKSVVWR